MTITPNDHRSEDDTAGDEQMMDPARTGADTPRSGQEDLDMEAIGDFPMLAACLAAWQAARLGDDLPASLDVGELPEAVLDYTMLLDYLPAQRDAAVRMVGTYVGEKAAFQAHGMTVRAFFEERDAEVVTAALRRIAESREPSLARRTFVPIGGAPMSYVRLILPLSANGRSVTGFFKTIEPSSLSDEVDASA